MQRLGTGRFARLSMIVLASAALGLAACQPLKKHKPAVIATFNCVPGAVQESQQFTVPAGVTQLSIGALGGQGGAGESLGTNAGGAGGKGGAASGAFVVTPGQVLTVNVGCAGATGSADGGKGGAPDGLGGSGRGGGTIGGTPLGGSGGGESEVRNAGTVLVAAGGGGGGGGAGTDPGGSGGGGGGTSGVPGGDGGSTPACSGGGGGTQGAGGGGGANCGGTDGDPAVNPAGGRGGDKHGGGGGPGDHPAIEHRPMRGNGHAYGREQPPGGPVRSCPVVNYDENHHHDWRRGERVPAEYRDRQYVIDDWRAYHLAQPPRGYEWIGIGGDHLLVQIGSGVVFQIGL